MPLPLVVADGQYFNKSEESSAPKEPIYEFSPWEFGTYDNSIYGSAPLQFLGSRFVNGVVPANETYGVDIAAQLRKLIPEISSQNAALGEVLSNAAEEYLGALSSTNSTVNGPAAYDPSPFYQYNKDSPPFAQDTRLTVVDGGEDGQNIPLNPLIQRKRNVDVIFAVDSGSDVAANWPNGTTMIATYERTLAGFANDTSSPDANTFVNLGLNSHPTFFGCNSSNLTAPAPLIVYLPNHPVTYMSNLALNESSSTPPGTTPSS
ncbi:hypothetical protein CNMCM5623_002505 [Aspergillus felis]|uniref:Lysophospholipase n=1 Tax=Aspergillus felis TaxID=1287682 RepID=A0A8H6QCG8_9EURO|nr:hypothetical protein CNMCM5623_002505 [Aspergillus felis]